MSGEIAKTAGGATAEPGHPARESESPDISTPRDRSGIAGRSVLIENFGIIHTADYVLLLQLTGIAGVWHHVDILAGSLATLDSPQRAAAEQLFEQYFRGRIALVAGFSKTLEQAAANSAKDALCRDTAMVHAEELTQILNRYIGGRRSLPKLRTFLQDRAANLAGQLTRATSYTDIAWCAPVVVMQSPVYHLEIGALGVELRYSLDSS